MERARKAHCERESRCGWRTRRGRPGFLDVRSAKHLAYKDCAGIVSHWRISPVAMPRRSHRHRCRCSLVPCVNASGTTRPCDCRCNRSSLIAPAAFRPCSKLPGSISFASNCCATAAHTLRLQFEAHEQRIAPRLRHAQIRACAVSARRLIHHPGKNGRRHGHGWRLSFSRARQILILVLRWLPSAEVALYGSTSAASLGFAVQTPKAGQRAS